MVYQLSVMVETAVVHVGAHQSSAIYIRCSTERCTMGLSGMMEMMGMTSSAVRS